MIYPPRPENAISRCFIKTYEDKGWIAQKKVNGTCQVITISHGKVDFKTRHGSANKAWKPSPALISLFDGFHDSTFIGELLHNKGPWIKDTIHLFDVIKFMGKPLLGSKFLYRQGILNQIKFLSKSIEIVKNYDRDLTGLYDSLSNPWEEGIVLKNPNGVLETCVRKNTNQGWQIKCRKEHKNYGF